MTEALRKCRYCGLQAKTIGELSLFKKSKQCPYGRENQCKECANKSAKSYYQRNKLRYKLTNHRYFESHREDYRQRAKKWREKYPVLSLLKL